MDGVSEIIAHTGGTDVICHRAQLSPRLRVSHAAGTRARHGYYRNGTD
jgi:hypothetical protein